MKHQQHHQHSEKELTNKKVLGGGKVVLKLKVRVKVVKCKATLVSRQEDAVDEQNQVERGGKGELEKKVGRHYVQKTRQTVHQTDDGVVAEECEVVFLVVVDVPQVITLLNLLVEGRLQLTPLVKNDSAADYDAQ